MSTHRPGDILAGRYRLTDLLSETGRGRFWLAHDSILGRAVAVHVLDVDDPRADALMEAARASASIVDPHLLRVLDAETRDGMAYVVNEWGRGTSLDTLLIRSGPLAPRRAAWITAEVAAPLVKGHELGHAHGRLNPENVLIDEAGEVRIIGFAVEAALYGLPPGTPADDDAQLAAILGACLTGTWSGSTESSLPRTPQQQGHPLRPRQVRAGVPRVLDDLCDNALNPSARGRHEGPTLDARYIRESLLRFLGDPSDVAGLPAEHVEDIAPPATALTLTTSLRMPPVDETAGLAPEPAGTPNVAPGTTAGPTGSGILDLPHPPDEGAPTEAGLPSFDEDALDDDWHRPRDVPAPPPPVLEPPAPKPLFADEVPPTQPIAAAPEASRTDGAGDLTLHDVPVPLASAPEPDATSVTPTDSADPADPADGHGEDYWPWAEEGGQRRRSRWTVPVIALAVLVLVVAGFLLVRQLNGGSGGSGGPSSTTAKPAAPITGVTASDFDPLGDGSENPQDAPDAVDGKPSTYWLTLIYKAQLGPKPPSLKSGVGLLLDLRGRYAVSRADLTLVGSPTTVAFYVADTKPSGVDGLKPVATKTVSGTSARIDLGGAKGRYVVVWLTALPQVPGGYRGRVAEVHLSGSPLG